MMLEKIHPSIRGALIIFCVIFIAAIASVISAQIYLDSISADEKKARINTQQWKNKIEQAKVNNQIIVEYEKPYLKLKDDGVIGEENRLSWFETLQATATSRGLDSFKFSTASQLKVNSKDMDAAFSNLNVYRSIMVLDMKVSHEGDIFAVFNELEANAKGLYSVNKCSVVKNQLRTGKAAVNEIGIKANCELTWHSIKPQANKS